MEPDTAGEIWYAAGQQWAMKNEISDGTNPNGMVIREQIAAMLYRYAQMKMLIYLIIQMLKKFCENVIV